MDRKMLNRIIPLLSVVIFFLWGWLEGSFQHSWIIFVIGGGAMGIISSLDKGTKKDEEKKPEKPEENEETE